VHSSLPKTHPHFPVQPKDAPLFPWFSLAFPNGSGWVAIGIRPRCCSLVCTECEKLLHTFQLQRDIILCTYSSYFYYYYYFIIPSAQCGLTFVRCIEMEAQTQTLGDLVHRCQTKTAILAVGSVMSVSVKAIFSFKHLAKSGS